MSNHRPPEFLLNNSLLKLCSICGEKKKLTFEHIPPQGTGNNKPVNIIGLENMVELGGYLYKKFTKSKRGLGGYKLCTKCNELTGAWYGESYIEHSNEVARKINENWSSDKFEIRCKLKPLNFLKQVVSILLCSDQATGVLRQKFEGTDFMMVKENKNLPAGLFINQIITLQVQYGFKGYTSEWNDVEGYIQNVEFAYKPFYFRAVFDKTQILKNSMSICDYSKYEYDQVVEVLYKIEMPEILRKSK